jgi:hypothetical protein
VSVDVSAELGLNGAENVDWPSVVALIQAPVGVLAKLVGAGMPSMEFVAQITSHSDGNSPPLVRHMK